METNAYGFTVKSDSGTLHSWVIDAVSRRSAFDQLQQGWKPDQLLVLTCRLTEAQRNAWIQASTEHGGFDDQMASSLLNTYA